MAKCQTSEVDEKSTLVSLRHSGVKFGNHCWATLESIAVKSGICCWIQMLCNNEIRELQLLSNNDTYDALDQQPRKGMYAKKLFGIMLVQDWFKVQERSGITRVQEWYKTQK
jgi:hypothetical protein